MSLLTAAFLMDRYGPLLDDLYQRGVVAGDPSLYLHHPTATDPAMAPVPAAQPPEISPGLCSGS